MLDWPVDHVAAGVIDRSGARVDVGDVHRVFELASVTKPLFAMAVWVAIEEGSLALDEPVRPLVTDAPEGVTVRHLLAHAGGLDPDRRTAVAPPGERRIYSNAGFEILGDARARRTGFTTADYLRAAVVAPLQLRSTELRGSPAHGAVSSVDDLLRVGRELLAPTLFHPSTLAEATTEQFAGIGGVLPGFGRQHPNPWGLGVEIRGDKAPHWTTSANDPSTFGHFGRAGTMLWVDPVAGRACVALTDRTFGPWAAEAWPPFSTTARTIDLTAT